MHYNFVLIHQTLRVTPAMAAGMSNRLWSIRDVVAISNRHSTTPRLTWWQISPVTIRSKQKYHRHLMIPNGDRHWNLLFIVFTKWPR